MRRAWHVAVAVVVTSVVTTAVTGCGVVDGLRTTDFAKQDGAEIVTAASRAMAEVTSMRITGQTRLDGNPVFLDVMLGDDSCTGTLRLDKSRLSLLRVGDRAWFKGDEAMYSRLSDVPLAREALTRLSTSWIRADELADVDFCDLDRHLAAFSLEPAGKGGKGGKVGKAKEDGREWVALADLVVGEEVDLDGGRAVQVASTPDDTAWISSEAPHYVVRLESTVPRDGGYLSYTEFNRDVVVEAPKGKDVFTP